MYLAHKNVHADALAYLAASLALSAGATEKALAYSHDLYCPKFALENDQIPARNLQVKETLETLAGPRAQILAILVYRQRIVLHFA